MHLGYLSVIVGYFAVVLMIGVWGAKKGSYDSYTVADRDVGLPLSVGTFFATYISSATVIGFVGYTSLSGASIFPTYFWGFALGWLALSMIAGRMRRLGLRSVPSTSKHVSGALLFGSSPLSSPWWPSPSAS